MITTLPVNDPQMSTDEEVEKAEKERIARLERMRAEKADPGKRATEKGRQEPESESAPRRASCP